MLYSKSPSRMLNHFDSKFRKAKLQRESYFVLDYLLDVEKYPDSIGKGRSRIRRSSPGKLYPLGLTQHCDKLG